MKCPICGYDVIIEKTQAWKESHGYHGNYWYSIECKNCDYPKEESVSDVYCTEAEAIKLVKQQWLEQYNKINKLLEQRGNQK